MPWLVAYLKNHTEVVSRSEKKRVLSVMTRIVLIVSAPSVRACVRARASGVHMARAHSQRHSKRVEAFKT